MTDDSRREGLVGDSVDRALNCAMIGTLRRSVSLKRVSLLSVLLVALTACIAQPSEAPVVQLKSPENGVEVSLGERVLVQSVAHDDNTSPDHVARGQACNTPSPR